MSAPLTIERYLAAHASIQQHLLGPQGHVEPHLLRHLLGLDVGAIHVDRPLTNMIVAYENRDYVADKLMPVVTVAKRSDVYFQFNVRELFSSMSSELASQRGKPHEISSQVAADGNYSVKDYALVYFVSSDEESNADAPLQPRAVGNRKLWNALTLGREIRVANKVFGAGNYGSNTSALAGAARWDQPTSDPVQDIDDAIESCVVRPTHMTIGAQAWIKLRNHPKLLQYILSRTATLNGNVPMRVTQQLVAEAFELDEVVVGRAKYMSNVEGQSNTEAYVWGKSCALIRVEKQPSISETSTFGYTFRFGTWETRVIPELLSGVRGGIYLKQSFSDDEKVVGGGNTGFLYTTVVS